MENLYQPYIIKKRRTKFFWIKVVVAVVLIVVLFLVFISKALNLKVFGWLFSKNDEINNQIELHFVAKNAVNSQISVNEMAKTYRARGAAGIVFDFNNAQYVVLSCYTTIKDANAIVKSLGATEVDIEVFTLKITKPNDENLVDEDKQLFNTIFEFFKEVVTKLDNIIINLSKQSLTDVNANLQINNLLLKSKFYQQKLLEKEKLETTSYVLSCVTSILEYISGETALSENYLSYQAEIRRAFVRVGIAVYESFKNL